MKALRLCLAFVVVFVMSVGAVDDSTAIAFSNDEIRTVADNFAQLYNKCKGIQNRWNALGGASMIPNTVGDTIQDGSPSDGRPVIDGAKANNVMTRVIEFVTDMEAGSNAKLNTVLQVAVNPNEN